MADDETVRGEVLGPPGEIVAGYAHLGAKGTRRPLGGLLRVRTAEGVEVELVDIAAATIAPVVRTRGEWQEIEGAAGALACLADAPAPDVTVELFAALVRGGDRIAAEGHARETAFSPAAEGAAFRAMPAQQLAKLAPTRIFLGPTADQLLADAQHADAQARATKAHDHAEAADRAARIAAVPRAEPSRPEALPPPPGHWLVRTTVAWIFLMLGLGALALRASPLGQIAWLLVAAALGLVPLLLDLGDASPVFRKTTRRSNAWIVGTLVVSALLAAAFAVIQTQATDGGRHPSPDTGMLGLSAVLATASVVMNVWLLGRRRASAQFLRRVRTARMHAAAPIDGAWGALEGTIHATDPATIGGHALVIAAGEEVRYRGAGKNASSSTTPLSAINGDAWMESEHGKLALPIGEATWMSLELFATPSEAPTGTRLAIVSARLLRPGQPVRVVGRTQHGAFVKGGEDSLLVFGGKVDRSIAPTLASLVTRVRLTSFVAVLAAACSLAAIVQILAR